MLLEFCSIVKGYDHRTLLNIEGCSRQEKPRLFGPGWKRTIPDFDKKNYRYSNLEQKQWWFSSQLTKWIPAAKKLHCIRYADTVKWMCRHILRENSPSFGKTAAVEFMWPPIGSLFSGNVYYRSNWKWCLFYGDFCYVSSAFMWCGWLMPLPLDPQWDSRGKKRSTWRLHATRHAT